MRLDNSRAPDNLRRWLRFTPCRARSVEYYSDYPHQQLSPGFSPRHSGDAAASSNAKSGLGSWAAAPKGTQAPPVFNPRRHPPGTQDNLACRRRPLNHKVRGPNRARCACFNLGHSQRNNIIIIPDQCWKLFGWHPNSYTPPAHHVSLLGSRVNGFILCGEVAMLVVSGLLQTWMRHGRLDVIFTEYKTNPTQP